MPPPDYCSHTCSSTLLHRSIEGMQNSLLRQRAEQQILHAMLPAQVPPNGLALADAITLLSCVLRELEEVIDRAVCFHLCPSCHI